MKSKLKKKQLLLLLLNTVTYTSLSLLSNKIHLCFPKVLLSHFSAPPTTCIVFFWLQCMWDLSSPTRDWTHTPGPGGESPNHWTTMEVPTQCWQIMFWSIQRSSKLYLLNGIMETTTEWVKYRVSTQMSLDSNPGLTTNSYTTLNNSIISPNLSFLVIK